MNTENIEDKYSGKELFEKLLNYFKDGISVTDERFYLFYTISYMSTHLPQSILDSILSRPHSQDKNWKSRVDNGFLVHRKDLEKHIIDNDNKYIFLQCQMDDDVYLAINDLEGTFFYPTDKNRDKFNAFILHLPLYTVFNCNFIKMKSKEDGTLSTAIYMAGTDTEPNPTIIFEIIKSKENFNRIDYIIKKHNIENKILILNKNKKIQKKRNPISTALRHECFKRDNYTCVECGTSHKESSLHIDHIIPISDGGTDELSNLQTLCQKCNLSKSNRNWVGGV